MSRGKKPKITAQKVMYVAAFQVVVTTVGFILYRRPYLWAFSVLKWYKEEWCGTNLDNAKEKMKTYGFGEMFETSSKLGSASRFMRYAAYPMKSFVALLRPVYAKRLSGDAGTPRGTTRDKSECLAWNTGLYAGEIS